MQTGNMPFAEFVENGLHIPQDKHKALFEESTSLAEFVAKYGIGPFFAGQEDITLYDLAVTCVGLWTLRDSYLKLYNETVEHALLKQQAEKQKDQVAEVLPIEEIVVPEDAGIEGEVSG